MMTYFLLFCLLLSHTEAKSIPQPPPAPSPDHFPLDSWPKDPLFPRHGCPSPAQPDHFWLVHTWPKGFCSNLSVTCAPPNNLRDKLTIHGWWPVDKTDRTLNNYGQVGSINYVFTRSLYSGMILDWPNLQSDIKHRYLQIPFWKHEWARHGICSGFKPGLYFDKALALKKRLSISEILKAKGIVPLPLTGSSYTRQDFENALRGKIPANAFALNCFWKSGLKILFEIIVCTNDTDAIPCTRPRRNNCGDRDIKFVSEVR